MVAGCVSMGISFYLLMSPPQGMSTVVLFVWLLVTTMLFRFTSALYRVTYLALGAEMSADYDERTTIVALRSLLGLCGTLVAASFSLVLFFPNTTPGVDPKLSYSAYPLMGAAFGALMTLTAVVGIAGTYRNYRSRREGDAPAQRFAEFMQGFGSSLRNPSFRRVWVSFTLAFFALVVNAATALHFFTWYVRISDSAVLSRIQLCFYVGTLVGVAVWLRLARYVEKPVACQIASTGTACILFCAWLLMGEGGVFGTGNALPLFVGNFVAGLFAAGLWIIPASMLADVADADRLEHGQARGGLFFGMLNFGEKMAAGLSLLLGGVLLQFFVDLRPDGDPSAEAVSRIGLVYGAFPAAVLLLSAVPLFGYSLTRTAVTQIQEELTAGDHVARTRGAGPGRDYRVAIDAGRPQTAGDRL